MLHIVQQSIPFAASPDALYAMYLDPRDHAQITVSPLVRIDGSVGAEFWAFDGRIHGRILALTPGRQIVQSWRSFEWRDADLDATLILDFRANHGGTLLEMAQVNVPDHLYETLKANWAMRYWDPWKTYLARPRP
jgi:activator of HSP90 ATPase